MKDNGWIKVTLRELADRWQIPVLVLSVLLAALGIHHIIASQKSKSIEQYIAACDEFFSQQKYLQAAKLCAILLEDDNLKPNQRAHLESLLAQIFFIKEKELDTHSPKRLAIILKHLKRVAEIRELDANECFMLGYVCSWQKKYDKAAEYFKCVLSKDKKIDNTKRIETLKQLVKILPRTNKYNNEKEYVAILDKLYNVKGLSERDFVWVLSLKTELLFKSGKFSQAVKLLRNALKRVKNEADKLELEYSLALGEYYQKHLDVAEPALRDILNRLHSRGELDAKVTVLLGRICLDDYRPEESLAFFKQVIKAHPLSDYHLEALLYKGQAEIMLHRFDDALASYKECFSLLEQLGNNRLVSKKDILASLDKVSQSLADKGELAEAVLFAELQLNHIDKQNFPIRNVLMLRIADWYYQLAEAESKKLARILDAKLAANLHSQVKKYYLNAGRYYVEFSRSEGILHSDAADALWSGIIAYEKAGAKSRLVACLEEFIKNWPTNKHIPEALFKLADIYRHENRFVDAQKCYKKLIKEYTRTPWGLQSLVPLAKTYIALGPKYYDKAEAILRDIVDDTSRQELFTPESIEYRKALFLLGKLYYYLNKYNLSLARLEEAMERYKNAREIPEAQFILAQCYRKIANDYFTQAKSTLDRVIRQRLLRGWRSNLLIAKDAYRKAIAEFNALRFRNTLEENYLKLAYIYYADCLYDLGEYAKSVKAYERVIDRYDKSIVALASYVQIINAYQRLGQSVRTRAILERMKWLLNQLPDDVFTKQRVPFSRKDWQRWIDWNYRSGLIDYSNMGLASSN